MPALNREQLLDRFDGWSPSEHTGEELLGAYNALTGATATLVCTHCGSEDCPGAADTAKCPWIGIHRCFRCGSRRGYCVCSIANNE